MKHTPVAEISRVADVHPIPLKPPMTRVERLENATLRRRDVPPPK